MACPCCATDVCLCSDDRTKNCTYTISLSVPEKNYSVSLPMSCSEPLRTVPGVGLVRLPNIPIIPILDPGVQFLLQGLETVLTVNVGGDVLAYFSDCPGLLNRPLNFPYNIGFASQSCDTTADNGALSGAKFHITVVLHNRNGPGVFNQNRYHYLYRIFVDPNSNAVGSAVVWQGQTGLGSELCAPFGPTPPVRCLPCYANRSSFCGTNEGFTGEGHCPYDITTVTPTLTIACPP